VSGGAAIDATPAEKGGAVVINAQKKVELKVRVPGRG